MAGHGKKVGLVRSSGLPLRRIIELLLLMMMLIMPKILVRIVVKVLKTLLKDEVISKARIYSNEVESVKQRCLPNALKYPMLEECDFRNDTVSFISHQMLDLWQ
ncbi:uncharacterized protein [Aristolochia californica]|uniref:uncharacterized protein n=1 Tax=Aristolochia californica TaxID=171875 RepID=UPI0035D7B0DA